MFRSTSSKTKRLEKQGKGGAGVGELVGFTVGELIGQTVSNRVGSTGNVTVGEGEGVWRVHGDTGTPIVVAR